MKTGKKRVLILGGGFGGVYAAMRLEKLLAAMLARQEVEICLVSRDNFFLFTPMLHEIAASDLEITNIVNPLRKLLRRVEVIVGDVDQIDLPKTARPNYPAPGGGPYRMQSQRSAGVADFCGGRRRICRGGNRCRIK